MSPASRSSTGRASTRPTFGHGAISMRAEADVAARRRAAAFADEPARHRVLHRRTDPGRGRRPPLPARFPAAMHALCHEYDALLIFDEVQTGVGLTGTAWAYQQLGVEPDVVAFGKKTQVCGVMAGGRVDECRTTCSRQSRINSTWGGNLTDMVRARRILEVMESDGLFERAAEQGCYLRRALMQLADDFPGVVRHPRGRGLMCAFSLSSTATATS